MTGPDLTGHYAISDWGFSVVERDGLLFLDTPGVPERFAPRLEPVDGDTVRVLTGWLHGAELSFTVEDGAVTGGLAGGVIPVQRLDRPPVQAPGGGLRAPDLPDDPERDERFAALWAAGGPLIDTGPDPVHRFVQWLAARGEVVFHGSNRGDIDEFTPRRESVELVNAGGHGNLGAVYGTHQGLWSMFFAVIDRGRLRGSIRNGVATYESADGETIDLYRFSIDHRDLPQRPFTTGALYLLPRDRFERIPLYPGGPPGNEWACFDPVRPLARIVVEPEDFPFLEQIGGHDDGPLLRMSELSRVVFSGVKAATRVEGGFRLVLEDLDPAVVEEWVRLGRELFPDVERSVLDDRTVEMTGPDAFIHTMEQRLGDLLG